MALPQNLPSTIEVWKHFSPELLLRPFKYHTDNSNSLFGNVHPNKLELLTKHSINNPSTEFNAKFYISTANTLLPPITTQELRLTNHSDSLLPTGKKKTMSNWRHWQCRQRLMQKVTKITRHVTI